MKQKRSKTSVSKNNSSLKKILAFCLCFLFVVTAVPVGMYFVTAEDAETGSQTEEASTLMGGEASSSASNDGNQNIPSSDPESGGQEENTAGQNTQENDKAGSGKAGAENDSANTNETAGGSAPAKAPQKAPAQISLKEAASALNNVPVYVRINGTEQTGTFNLKPGNISDSAASQDTAIRAQYGITNDSTKFRKAVLLSASGDVETEISRAGTYNGTVYYSLHDYDDTGVALKDGEKIVLIYQTRYTVTTHIIGLDSDGTQTTNPGGSVTVADEVYYTDNLRIQAVPDTANLYRLQSITYTSGNNAGTVDFSNNAATLSADNYDGDIVLTVTFKVPETFKITNVTPSRTDEYNTSKVTQGHGDLIANRYGPVQGSNTELITIVNKVLQDAQRTDLPNQNEIYDLACFHVVDGGYYYYYKEYRKNQLDQPLYDLIVYYRSTKNYPTVAEMAPANVAPRGTTTFYLQSQANTGGTDYELNKLEINGTLLDIPAKEGETAVTEIDGMKVSVYFESVNKFGCFWNDSDGTIYDTTGLEIGTIYWNTWARVGWDKPRAYYRITVENVNSDLAVNYSFKEKSKMELTILGLNGINRTGMSKESRELVGDYKYYYFATTNEYHKYDAFWRDSSTTSNNLVLYSVKPGYNPYTVSTEMSYDNGPKTSEGVLIPGSKASTPEEAIYSAGGRYNTGHRFWGRNSILKTKDEKKSKKNLLLTSLQDDPVYNTTTWYAVALEQNKANNWMLYLNASPYQYHVEYDMKGGKITEEDRSKLTSNFILSEDGTALEDTIIRTVEDEQDYFNMPLATPEKTGFIFDGWQLARRKTVTATIYQEYPNGKYYSQQDDGNDNLVKTYYTSLAEAEAAVVTPVITDTAVDGWTHDGTNSVIHEGETKEETDDQGTVTTVTTDTSIVYTLTFTQEVSKTYEPNELFSLSDDNYANLAYVSGDVTTDEDMYFTFVAKYLSVDTSQNTEVDYKVWVQVPEGTTGTEANPVEVKDGKTYQLSYHSSELQLIGDTVALNQYAPENADYYAYNETLSRVSTTTAHMNTDGSIPEENKLYIYYDYRYQKLTVDEDTRGDYANYLKSFDITVTLERDPDDVSPIAIPAAGETVTYGDLEFTSDGTKLTATTSMSKASSAKDLVVPYGWQYTVQGADEADYTLSYEDADGQGRVANGSLTKDETVAVIYTKTDVSPTGIMDSTVFQASLLGVVALISGGAALLYFLKRKKNNGKA